MRMVAAIFSSGAQFEHIRDRAALGGAAHLRNFVNLLDVSAARFGEEHQVIVRGRGEEMLDEIAFFFLGRAFARGHADDALAAAALRAKGADGGAFDEAAVGDADDAAFVGDEILHVDLAFVGHDLVRRGEPYLSRISRSSFLMIVKTRDFLREDVAQILDRLDQLLVFVLDLVALEPGELIEAQIENLVGLLFAERVAAVGQARFVANEDADLLDLLSREFEGEQFDARFVAIGRPRMIRMNSSRFASAMR